MKHKIKSLIEMASEAIRCEEHKNSVLRIKKVEKRKIQIEETKKKRFQKKIARLTGQNFDGIELQTEALFGRVIRVNKESYIVKYENKELRLKFKNNLDDLYPVVGDNILFAFSDILDGFDGEILEIAPRTSDFSRSSVIGNAKQVLVANIDQIIVYMPVNVDGGVNWGFIDRLVLAGYTNNLNVIIIINKKDLLNTVQQDDIRQKLLSFSSIKEVFLVSILNDTDDLLTIKNILLNKTSFLIGISGAGKSTLVNKLGIGTQEIRQINISSGRGQHTTSHSMLLYLPDGGSIIDTPGIQTFQTFKTSISILLDYLGMSAKISDFCRYTDCRHVNETFDDCAIKRAVQTGSISSDIYSRFCELVKICI